VSEFLCEGLLDLSHDSRLKVSIPSFIFFLDRRSLLNLTSHRHINILVRYQV
jgi:hypothetical protein